MTAQQINSPGFLTWSAANCETYECLVFRAHSLFLSPGILYRMCRLIFLKKEF